MSNIAKQDIHLLIDGWLKMEFEGVQFPVDFDVAWSIAGYSRKDAAKRKLPKRAQGKLYHISLEYTGGRPKENINLSCDGLKHLCLMAETEEGEAVRQYFIEAEKKWRMVQQQHPSIAQQIELQNLINEGLRLEAQKHQAELNLMQFRQNVVLMCPEIVQKKILGYQTIEKVEYRDRLIKDEQIINDGTTVTKTELCGRYDLFTRKGSPDYRRLNNLIEGAGLADNDELWEETYSIRENKQLKRSALPILDQYFDNAPRDRYILE